MSMAGSGSEPLGPRLGSGPSQAPHAANLWDAFQRTASERAGEPALLLANETIDYPSLARRVEQVAAWLVAQGLRQGDVVAIQLGKRAEAYGLFLACLRQGMPYVFVDVKNPIERTMGILKRIRPALLVSNSQIENPSGASVKVAQNETAGWWGGNLPGRTLVPAAPVRGTDPAYIMFTSGSTGEPKGAVIPHQGILSLMRWAKQSIVPAQGARLSNLNPLHFDNSVFDLYCGLVSGAALAPIETGTVINPMAWVRRLRDARVNVAFAVPTLFMTLDRLGLLTPESLPEINTFVFGGEGYPIAALRSFQRRFAGRARLINVYGPTETSCICSSIEITEATLAAAGTGFASLGRMHADFDHLILDEHGQIGKVGELWIGGPNVGLGYFANEEETRARFCQDPRQDRHGSIWYRTGDLVREDVDGLLWFQGRIDNQVKIRGHRIELEEIDLAAERHADVVRASCVAVAGPDGPELRLAYEADRELPAAQILEHLEAMLPAYMQPARLSQFARLPENANGKVDRRAVRKMMSDMGSDPAPSGSKPT